ncbi:hypothetical protein A10D4_04545 [Idiomarina xiamenensis 10-D-4]|uniref:Uncharacterized protein n=1 Tax=Idiomarina xiamenensis 10-D-4 TaxID=740709 RepID=K2JMV7_9GAMM|nr:hypothetical protein A10D4_04545 [Idiomarina xiamenensis 10-D-4]
MCGFNCLINANDLSSTTIANYIDGDLRGALYHILRCLSKPKTVFIGSCLSHKLTLSVTTKLTPSRMLALAPKPLSC